MAEPGAKSILEKRPPLPKRKPPSPSWEQKQHRKDIKMWQDKKRKKDLEKQTQLFDMCTHTCNVDYSSHSRKRKECEHYCKIERDEDVKIIQPRERRSIFGKRWTAISDDEKHPFRSSEQYQQQKWFGEGRLICPGTCPPGWDPLERSDCWIGENVKCGLPAGSYEDKQWYG